MTDHVAHVVALIEAGGGMRALVAEDRNDFNHAVHALLWRMDRESYVLVYETLAARGDETACQRMTEQDWASRIVYPEWFTSVALTETVHNWARP